MFDVRILDKAGKDKNLEHSEFRVFFIVLNEMAKNRLTVKEWNYPDLTSKLKMSESTVKRALKKLEKYGYIERKKKRYSVIIKLEKGVVMWKCSEVTSDPTDNTSKVTSEVTSDPTFIISRKYNYNNNKFKFNSTRDQEVHDKKEKNGILNNKQDEIVEVAPWETSNDEDEYSTF